MSNLANLDYLARVNRAIDHVNQHLAEPLRLEEVARVACFSPYHFHRIFRAVVGETLQDFVKRLRLERALSLLSHTPRPRLTDVALACGFASSSDFSRSFRQRYGVAPRAFDLGAFRASNREALERATGGSPRISRLPEGANPDGFTVRLGELGPTRVAYLRVFRPYEGQVPATAARLVAWARERGLAGGQWLGYQWDDPEIVPLAACRYDVGVVVPEGVALDEAVSEARFPALRVAELSIAGGIELELRALDWLYRTWLPASGLVPDHQPAFEVWSGEPFAHGLTHFELTVRLPVVDP